MMMMYVLVFNVTVQMDILTSSDVKNENAVFEQEDEKDLVSACACRSRSRWRQLDLFPEFP